MLLPKPTSAEVELHRKEHECSRFEAFTHLHSAWRAKCLADIRQRAGELHTVNQCRDVIVDLLDLLKESQS
jgi:hypothetical protein